MLRNSKKIFQNFITSVTCIDFSTNPAELCQAAVSKEPMTDQQDGHLLAQTTRCTWVTVGHNSLVDIPLGPTRSRLIVAQNQVKFIRINHGTVILNSL